MENSRESDVGSGVFGQAMDIDNHRSIIDTEACATYSEVVIASASNPHVIGTQIWLAENDDGELIAELIDSIATTEGDWLFDSAMTLQYVLGEDWGLIPEEQRDTRETIKAAADAYLDLWGDGTAPVPWEQPCRRLEGSAYTGSGSETDDCNVGIPEGGSPPVSGRRYVIDNTFGSANVLCTFEVMGDVPDGHEIRLEGGKLRFVHTMTVMRDLD